MISGVAAVDDAGYPPGIPETKSSSDTNADPQASLQGSGTPKPGGDSDGAVQTGATTLDGFGDRFSPGSAQTLLDAQEALPATAPLASDDTAASSRNPLDTDQDGAVSFVEWQQSQADNPLDTDGDGTVSFVEWLKSQNDGDVAATQTGADRSA